MSRNQNSHFSLAPHANIPRSRFDMSHTVKQTMNAGVLVPFEVKEVLPGDTFSVSTSILARLQTLMVPIMDDMYLDTYYFYVPNRLLWKNWERFCGESDEPWFDDEHTYSIPQIQVDLAPGAQEVTGGVKKGTVADYLGMPLAKALGTGESHVAAKRKFNHLPFRAYVKIWNDWFRNENTQALATFNTEDNDVVMDNTAGAFYGGDLLPVQRYRDYFSSCLPLPQRGEATSVYMTSETIPVHTFNENLVTKRGYGLRMMPTAASADFTADTSMSAYIRTAGSDADPMYGTVRWGSGTPGTQSHYGYLQPINLGIDSLEAGIDINQLRYAFATQRYLEALARSGSRYIEMLEGIFGVQSPDARLQRSEYLGGNRVALSISQAVQQSETSSTPLGNIGAYSLTTDSQGSFSKSFVEHGWIIGVCCVRYNHSYQDGYERFWSRKDFEDFYNPYFANIGEQPVLNQEIYADGSSTDLEVFGYQEAWADYRYANNRIAGEMRSRYATPLDSWHLADNYTSQPYLDDTWSCEDGSVIDRVIAVSQRTADQILIDMYINIEATRPMPVYSVPGLDIL